MWLFLAFIAVPLIEIALFIQVGGLIGLWPTLLIVVITAVIGTNLVRSQGGQAMNNLRNSFNQLDDPTRPLADGAMILFAGALLLTPGFFTDALGFALLTPPFRAFVYKKLREKVEVRAFDMGQRPPQQPRQPQDTVIDGDFQEIDPDKKSTHPSSGWTKH